jgi:hypothetical protein
MMFADDRDTPVTSDVGLINGTDEEGRSIVDTVPRLLG